MESLQDLIGKCEKAKYQIISLSKRDKCSYDEDLFPRSLKDFLNNIMLCMKRTPSIPCGNRFHNWWKLLWDRCAMDRTINKYARDYLSGNVYTNIQQETVTWKLKYLILTIVHFALHDIPYTSQYLQRLISLMRQGTQFPIQLTYYQVILVIFEVHRATHGEYLLNVMQQTLGDISDVDIIDPQLHQMDTDQYCRSVLNGINRQSEPPVIFSIQCAEANLMHKKLLAPRKNGKLWIDFNLRAKTITLMCQRSCLRTERPSIDSEEFDDCTAEILTINFDNIDKITERIWGHREGLQVKLIVFTLNKSSSYMYESSGAAVEQANKLFLNFEEGDELNRLLEILPATFPARFERLRKRPELQGSEQNISHNGQSSLLLSPYTGRAVSVGSMTSLENSHLENDTGAQVAIAHKEMLSLSRSGPTLHSFCQITIHAYANENWPATNSRILPNENPNNGRLSLTTGNGNEEDTLIESSQGNKSSTLSTLQEKIDRTVGKYYPEPYNPQESTTTLDTMYNPRFDSSSYKENQPVNISQHLSSSAKDVLSTTVMNNSMPKLSRNQLETVTDVINLSSQSDSDSVNKFSGNGPSPVNDRLKDILAQSDYDDESVLSDISDKSIIISGGLLNWSNIGRSLPKRSIIEQDSQNSTKNFPTKITPNRSSTSVSSKSLADLFTQKQSQRSQDTLSSSAKFLRRSPMIIFGKQYHPENVATSENILSQKTPIGLSQKSNGSNSSSIDFQQSVAEQNNPFQNWNSLSISQNRKRKLNKSLNLPPTDSRERFETNNLNDSAEAILENALGNPELPKKLKLTIPNNSFHEPVFPSSSQSDIYLSSQKSRTPEAVNKKPLHQRPLSVQTPETILTNEIRDILKTSEYSPQTSTLITPSSGISFQSARSRLSVPPSICTDTQSDTARYDAASCSIEDDLSGELVIDLNEEPVHVNDKHDTNESINAPVTVTVQPAVRRKRGRPSKANVLNTDDACDSANSTAYSINSTKRSKRRPKKRKNKCECDCDSTDEVNCTTELPAVESKDEEKERKRLQRFSTRTRRTKPPIRYTDELNKSYLESVKGEIRRKRESGYLTDTVVYQKRPSRRAPRTDTALERLNQTLDVNLTDYRYGTDFESVNVERDTQSDVEVGERQRKKKKKRKRIRTQYDSSLIDMDESIRLRLSRRNSSCELLTQDSDLYGEALQSESQDSHVFDEVFNDLPIKCKTNGNNVKDVESPDTSKCSKFDYMQKWSVLHMRVQTVTETKHICDNEEDKKYVRNAYYGIGSMYNILKIKANMEKNFSTFL